MENQTLFLNLLVCFFHGHPCKYPAEVKSSFHGCTYGELHSKFADRVQTLIEAGYQVKVIWECEYDKKYDREESFAQFVDNCCVDSPLKPGDALFGGRNEVFTMYHKAEPTEKIQYEDFCSLYPAVMCMEEYPILYPSSISLNPSLSTLDTAFGLVKVVILPPQNIPIAVLPVRHSKEGKIFYTLCRTCSEQLNTFPCFHTEPERQFVGTYTTFELQNAMKHGYRIQRVLEVWDWCVEQHSGDVFKKYIKVFFEMKIASEGFPSHVKTDAEKRLIVLT